jgi:hypothetical protein
MASHAHRPGDSVSAAKITAYGVVAAAVIALVGTIIVALSNDKPVPPPVPSASTASKPRSADQLMMCAGVDMRKVPSELG